MVIWDASSDALAATVGGVPWGGTVNLVCPMGKKLSFDKDLVVENDDKFSITCTAVGMYWVRRLRDRFFLFCPVSRCA